ncbi:MFS transporter, partial [Candidatus Parcubacteria bacterium]|nr:MFS transporter [Candidatus Parcubacteria bacterium]
NVSIFYLIIFAVVLVILLNLHKLIKKFSKSAVFLVFIVIFAVAALSLSYLPVFWAGAVILIVNIIFFNLAFVVRDVILESYSEDKMSGRIRGLNLTIMNIGFILGPFLSAKILENGSFQTIFLIQFFIASLAFILAFFGLRKVNHRFKANVTIRALFNKMLKRKNIMRIYYISFILSFFYCLMIIYSPLYLRSIGMEWGKIGIIFTFMLIPFVLLEYPAGLLADKKIGEKEMIIAALAIMGFSTLSIFFINSTGIIIWMIVLFLTRVGASLLEILRDSYFYKRIDGYDVDIVEFFRTSRAVGFIIGSIVSGILFIFLPMKSVFIIIAIVIFSGLIPAFNLIDNKSEEEI